MAADIFKFILMRHHHERSIKPVQRLKWRSEQQFVIKTVKNPKIVRINIGHEKAWIRNFC